MSIALGAIRVTGLRRLRPPRGELLLDVTLSSDDAGAEPRWVCLPSALRPGSVAPDVRTAHTIDLYELGGGGSGSGSGRVVVARVRGKHPFAALLTAGGAELTLTGLPIECWGEPPEEFELELVTARGLLVDGRPLAEIVSRDLLSDHAATVDASPLADQRDVVESLGGGLGTRLEVSLVDPRASSRRVLVGELEPM